MNVLIVEDSDTVRKNLNSMLAEFDGVRIVGYAVGEEDAIRQVELLHPDAVVLDIKLQSGSGVNVLKHTKKHHADIKVIVLTNCTEDEYVEACRKAHADYFFDKSFQFMRVRDVFAEWNCTGSANSTAGNGMSD